MKLNSKLLKTLSFLVLSTPIAYAGDCEKLKEKYPYGNGISYIENCKENTDGKIIEIHFYDHNMTDKDVEEILSNDTIKSLYVK